MCLLNDSFPPLIDGVSNTVLNYALNIKKSGNTAAVVTPSNPQAYDENFDFPVVRYPSIDTTRIVGYRAGYPFSPDALGRIKELDINLIHSHCPFVSTIMARQLRSVIDAPLVFTYHTKFDIDIANAVNNKLLQEGAIRFIVENMEACDEVWVVSKGAGENLRSLGYTGSYTVMRNGVDCPRGRVTDGKVADIKQRYSCEDIPIFLYVGRMMWYKGLRLTLDALKLLSQSKTDFKMFFVGDGSDLDEIQNYTREIGVYDKCVFTGAVRDRELLRTFYSSADVFLFPSTYDTNGLVVREAAACGLASVLINGSCAAEDITDGKNGFLIEENAVSMFNTLKAVAANRPLAREVGEGAMRDIYVSWDDAIATASEHYREIIKCYKNGEYPQHTTLPDGFYKLQGELMHGLSYAYSIGRNILGKKKKNTVQQ